jgi:hypothetical protein
MAVARRRKGGEEIPERWVFWFAKPGSGAGQDFAQVQIRDGRMKQSSATEASSTVGSRADAAARLVRTVDPFRQ